MVNENTKYKELEAISWDSYISGGPNGRSLMRTGEYYHMVSARIGAEVVKHIQEGKDPRETLGLYQGEGEPRAPFSKVSDHVYLSPGISGLEAGINDFEGMFGLCGHEYNLVSFADHADSLELNGKIVDVGKKVIKRCPEFREIVPIQDYLRNGDNSRLSSDSDFRQSCLRYLCQQADFALESANCYEQDPENSGMLVNNLGNKPINELDGYTRKRIINPEYTYMPEEHLEAYQSLIRKYHSEIHEIVAE